MKKFMLALLFALATGTSLAQQLPNLDWRVIELEWRFIKERVGAPPDLPMPPIIVEPLPPGARMMFQFPIQIGRAHV